MLLLYKYSFEAWTNDSYTCFCILTWGKRCQCQTANWLVAASIYCWTVKIVISPEYMEHGLGQVWALLLINNHLN